MSNGTRQLLTSGTWYELKRTSSWLISKKNGAVATKQFLLTVVPVRMVGYKSFSYVTIRPDKKSAVRLYIIPVGAKLEVLKDGSFFIRNVVVPNGTPRLCQLRFHPQSAIHRPLKVVETPYSNGSKASVAKQGDFYIVTSG